MAKLSKAEIIEIVKQPIRSVEIEGAIAEEARARFHTEPSLSPILTTKAYNDYLLWVAKLIDKNKLDIFKHLLVTPIPTIDVSESIFNEVSKIFDGQDRYIGYKFIDETFAEDFTKYIKSLKDDEFWSTYALQALKNAYNSFMIVDLPKLAEDDVTIGDIRPTPYYYLLNIDKVLALDISQVTKQVEYIFFLDCENANYAYLFDDTSYYSFIREQSVWKLITESDHNLGYTPAKSFWSAPISSKSIVRKKGLISTSLGMFDKLLFKIISETHVELYAEYPIMTMYAQRCDYMDDAGNMCEQGKVKTLIKADGITGREFANSYMVCPKCKGGVASLGAGSIIEAPAVAKVGDANMIDAVKFVTVGVDSLKWINEKVTSLRNQLTYSIIGIVDEISGVAINKDQVASQFESRQSVLMDTKSRMEDIHKWTYETLALLRYGKSLVSVTINYGTKFFINTTGQLNEIYQRSRDSGMPAFELANQRSQIYATKYRSNPEMQTRVNILANLEPYQDYSVAQIKELSTLPGLFSPDMLALKANMYSYILRFEREYTDLNSFMQYSDFNTKIEVIKNILMGYVLESKQVVNTI